MDIRFNVSFDQTSFNTSERGFKKVINHYVNQELDTYTFEEKHIIEIVENLPLRVRFTSLNNEDRLYFDLFDNISYSFDIDENGTPFLHPIDSFSIFEHNNQYMMLTPGYYKISVYSDKKWYYSLLKITSKQMKEPQWIAMRNEIEEAVTGLAKGILQKKLGNEIVQGDDNSLDVFNKLRLIEENLILWNNANFGIKTSLRSSVKKEYKAVEKIQIRTLDPVVLRNLSMFPTRKKIQSPKNKINYDLPENRELKFYISLILKEVNKLFQSIENINKRISSEMKQLNEVIKYGLGKDTLALERINTTKKEIQHYTILLKKIMNDCQEFLESELLEEVGDPSFSGFSIAFSANPFYKNIKKFYKLFEQKELSLKLHFFYDHCWKSSDKLYEIWGLLQFIKVLESPEFGFTIESNNLFEINNDTIYNVPFIDSGSKIVFVRGEMRLELVYDYKIPKRPVDIRTCPLCIDEGHNRPDLRLDFYVGEYQGSVLVDFKYRPPQNVWSNGEFGSKNQLKDYKKSMRSNFLSPKLVKFSRHFGLRVDAVREVLAIYPKHTNNRSITVDDEGIEFIELTPLEPNLIFVKKIKEMLDDIENQILKINAALEFIPHLEK